MNSLNYGLISSLCALVIGVLLVVWSGVAVTYLVMAIGALFLIPGLFGICSYFYVVWKTRQEDGIRVIFPVVAVGSALLGLWLIISPDFFVKILMYVLGILLLLGGLNQLGGLVAARRYVSVPVLMYIVSVLIMAAGFVVLFNPFEAAMVPFIVLGVSFIVYALTDFLRLIRFHRKERNVQDVTPIEETKEE